MRKDTGARTILIQHILREGIFLVHFFAHSNYHSHHTCSTIELAKACNDSQINQNLTTRRFWNVMSDLMPENGGPFFSKLFLKSVSLHLDFHTEAHNQDMACGSNVIGRRRGINRCYPSILGAVLFFSLWHIILVHTSEVAKCWLFNKELLLSSQDQGSEA